MALIAETGGPTVVVAEENAAHHRPSRGPPIIGGALAAVAISLLLVALGSGIGLSSVSPWSSLNPSATTFTLLAAVWLIIVQWLSSATGRLLSRDGCAPNGLTSTRTRYSFATRCMAFWPGRWRRFWSRPSPLPQSLRR